MIIFNTILQIYTKTKGIIFYMRKYKEKINYVVLRIKESGPLIFSYVR